ncbi:MAG: hypothetical protein MUP66_01975 [Candidatus Nanohaloarchaeota archaeon QJJ-5]|nr:hypothetical protein [Candidatus Nanohaloarchaeota archaeon QJJ-5]
MPADDPQQEIEELRHVNAKYAELVELLLDQIEGEEEQEYSYSFRDGWKENKKDQIQEELESDDLDAQLREIKHLIDRYSKD